MPWADGKVAGGRILRRGLLCFVLAIGIGASHVTPAQPATVSGSILIPDSDMGYKPNLYAMTSKVRVEGTNISVNVTVANRYEGTFTLTNVPAGANTLLFIEGDTDIFTQASKRVQVNVSGDLTDVSFNLVYHWKNLAGYPPKWGTTGYVSEWVPHFVSDQVGFILFRVRGSGIDPERVELYRTLNGGETWEEIGHWESGASVYPDFLNRYLYFADQDHGVIQALVDTNTNPDVTWYHTQGALFTSDGGATWHYSDFPNPPETAASGDVAIGRFAGISDTHWIACGSNGGTYTYGLPNYQVIWETTNAGQTWEIKMYWQEDGGGCTGLGADLNGKAIAFFTPYAWGGGMKVALRDSSGNWSRVDNNALITNSGYGPADIPMIGDTAWVRNDDHSTLPVGVYRTTDAGLNWEKISDFLPQYMAFATENKGFGPAGGPAYVTYDGGVTWLYQSGGGGSCCHGNNIWAFDTTHAVWHDWGVGDPNSAAAIFTYVEPWEANFEIVSGIAIGNGMFRGGTSNVPLASYKLFSHGPVPIRINGIMLKASGTGNDYSDISQVKIWHDRNANGTVDEGDIQLAQGVYDADDGSLPLSFVGGPVLNQLVPLYLLVTYDFKSGVAPYKTFICTVTANGVGAERTDTNDPISPTAPLDYPLAGRQAASAEKIIDIDGDGKTDILWSNTSSGRTTVWYLNGVMWSGSYADILPTVNDPNWTIVGVADFNGDRKLDILMRNTRENRTAVWYMDGATWSGSSADIVPAVSDSNWIIVGVADFNGDLKPDILWRNISTGRTTVWHMDGATWSGSYADILPTVSDPNWTIVGVADFNGDFKPDILWRNISTGRSTVWYMNGATWNGGYVDLPTVSDQDWTIVGLSDFNGDFKPDVLWRNATSGRTTVWYMNEAIWTGQYDDITPTVADPSWVIVGK
jgi:hypothetical protein